MSGYKGKYIAFNINGETHVTLDNNIFTGSVILVIKNKTLSVKNIHGDSLENMIFSNSIDYVELTDDQIRRVKQIVEKYEATDNTYRSIIKYNEMFPETPLKLSIGTLEPLNFQKRICADLVQMIIKE